MSRAEEVARVAIGVGDLLRREVPAGRVLLINNTGFGSYGPFPEPNLSQQLEMMDVNMRALVQLTGLMLPLLRERGGAVINIASTAAFQPTAYMATYGATKTFVLHWSLALNEELRGTGVRMLAVCPGATATGFFQRAGMQPGNALEQAGMSCDAVVTMALRALAAGRSQVVTGWKNKLSAFAGSLPSKPFAARVAAKLVARFRLKKGSQ